MPPSTLGTNPPDVQGTAIVEPIPRLSVARAPLAAHRLILRAALPAVALVALGLLAAACGPSPSSGSGVNDTNALDSKFLAYAQCMRAHGISDFPDPQGGGITLPNNAGSNGDLDPNNPRFQAADQACRSLAPQGHAAPTPNPQNQAELLQFAQCMRSHGIADFPEPTNGSLHLNGSGDLSPSNPQLQAAEKACKSILNGAPIPINGGSGGGG